MKKLIPGLLSMLLCLGMATGCEVIISTTTELRSVAKAGKRFTPHIDEEQRTSALVGWHDAIRRTLMRP